MTTKHGPFVANVCVVRGVGFQKNLTDGSRYRAGKAYCSSSKMQIIFYQSHPNHTICYAHAVCVWTMNFHENSSNRTQDTGWRVRGIIFFLENRSIGMCDTAKRYMAVLSQWP